MEWAAGPFTSEADQAGSEAGTDQNSEGLEKDGCYAN